jgi:hypothetical protein
MDDAEMNLPVRAGAVAHPLVVVTLRIGQHRPQLGVARRLLDVVGPPITEVGRPRSRGPASSQLP